MIISLFMFNYFLSRTHRFYKSQLIETKELLSKGIEEHCNHYRNAGTY